MRKLSPLEQSVVKWITAQTTSDITNFDIVLREHFFNDTYNMAFLFSCTPSQGTSAILYIEECDEYKSRMNISQFLEVVSFIKYLEESRLIYLLRNEVDEKMKWLTVIHEGWEILEPDEDKKSILNTEGLHLDLNDWNIKDNEGKVIYKSILLPKEYSLFGLKYLFTAIYATEELRKLVQRNFITEEEEALQIAQKSLTLTDSSLKLTLESLKSTKESLMWTKCAFGISIGALLIGAFSYNWSTSTIQEKQFDIMGDRNQQLIKAIDEHTLELRNRLDSIQKTVTFTLPLNADKK